MRIKSMVDGAKSDERQTTPTLRSPLAWAIEEGIITKVSSGY